MTHRARARTWIVLAIAAGASITTWDRPGLPLRAVHAQAPQAQTSAALAGQSATRLPDGRWLLAGGEGATTTASLWDPQARTAAATPGPMQMPRAGHSATLLADGTVLLLGGLSGATVVEGAELFDPASGTFRVIPIIGALPRVSHTATLLTDGRVLVVGGSNGGLAPLVTEVWDVAAGTVTPLDTARIDRVGQRATLEADGRVRISGGTALDGSPSREAVVIDPMSGGVLRAAAPAPDRAVPIVAGSIPVQGATQVAVDTRVAVRFSAPLAIESLTPETLTLAGPDGPVTVRLVAAEDGRLAFLWPAAPLAEATRFTLTIAGAVTPQGDEVVPSSITFTTVDHHADASSADTESWIPDEEAIKNGWRANRPTSPWESLAPLLAPPGVTAISGRVLTLDGRPLPRVTLAMDGAGDTRSDGTGRFLLEARSLSGGRHVLDIVGNTASQPTRTYGFFEYGLTVTPGRTTVLPFTIWMPKLDTVHTITVPSPTTTEIVITTPYIPGLELHLPPQTVIRGEDGQPVTRVSITPIPVDRTPFPLAKNVEVPVYFTIQPGGAYVATGGAGPKGAWLVYPNYRHGEPGQRVRFYQYDPDTLGWYVYGGGAVTPTGAQVMPDPTTRIYAFTGAMINGGGSGPTGAGPTGGGGPKGDPVDPSTGIFVLHKTDLYLPDVMPVALTRTYESGDTGTPRPFGRAMTHPYAMFLYSEHQYTEADLYPPEGTKIHYVRTSAGIGYADAVFEHTTTPTRFFKSRITWNGLGWNLTLADGTVYVFGDEAPLQAIRDRYGNQTTVTWTGANGFGSGYGNIARVTSPNGRWIAFTYDGGNRITQAQDNSGRTVGYTYDANGNLSTVTDPETNVTTYTWDASNRIATIKDGRQIVYLTNTYTNGRVTQQTLADPTASYQFAYTVDGNGNVTQTDVTDPRGHVERLAFNGDHYLTSDIQAYGDALARTTTIERQTGTNLVTALVDDLQVESQRRRTEYTYDSTGHVLTVKRLAGTTQAVTTTFTYEPKFSQLATITDPLNHTWTMSYDSNGRMTGVTDPLTHATGVGMNTAGQITQVTDPLTHAWHMGYANGDLTSITDPLNHMSTRFVDAAGRVIAATDPLGRVTRTAFDKLNRVTAVTDPHGGQTAFGYDANSNLLSLTDALTHATTYTYDTSDRAATRTDPLQKGASYAYDKNDHLTQLTDRKGQVTGYQYDALDRLSQVTFQDTTTITYTYDVADRLAQIVDAANGTITRTYDGLDRLTEEMTPQGTVDYTYDADGRRATMTVAGQTALSYAYDDAHRLTSITQGTSVVSITYDNADRRSTLTYPNGIIATSGYDDANQLTSLAYTLGQTTLGDLTYSYDAAGNRTGIGGSWARTGLPQAVLSATYDAANRLLTWSGQAFSHDFNGNLASDGLTSYTWNARRQLTGLSGAVSASLAYDGVSRRRNKVTSGTSTNFLYDRLNVVQELSGSTSTANLLTGLSVDDTLTRADGSGTSTLLTDALGSALALADASGAVQTQYTFDPFGSTTSSGPTSSNVAQFAGRENDGTGLYDSRARYYSPGLQRFVSEDPIGFDGGDVNLYSYVGNRPANGTDPLGLTVWNFDPKNPVAVKPEVGDWGKLPPCSEWPGSPDGSLNPGASNGPPWYKVPGKWYTPPNNVVIPPGNGAPICISGTCAWPWPIGGVVTLPKEPDSTWIPGHDLSSLPELKPIRPIPNCKKSKSDG